MIRGERVRRRSGKQLPYYQQISTVRRVGAWQERAVTFGYQYMLAGTR